MPRTTETAELQIIRLKVRPLVKRLYIVFDNDEFNQLKKIKEELGLSWPEVIRRGLECLLKERHRAI